LQSSAPPLFFFFFFFTENSFDLFVSKIERNLIKGTVMMIFWSESFKYYTRAITCNLLGNYSLIAKRMGCCFFHWQILLGKSICMKDVWNKWSDPVVFNKKFWNNFLLLIFHFFFKSDLLIVNKIFWLGENHSTPLKN
jgi:hypothetical protein